MASRYSGINKTQAGLVVLGVTAFGMMLKFSAHVPYVYSPGLFNFLLIGLFFLLSLSFTLLRYTAGKKKPTFYQSEYYLQNYGSLLGKAKLIFLTVVTSLLISWCLTQLPILPTQYFADKPYQATAQITNIKDQGRAVDLWAGVSLTFLDEHYSDTLTWPKHPFVDNVYVGDTIRLTGRQWLLGRTVEDIEVIKTRE
jgi:hypothetical protein